MIQPQELRIGNFIKFEKVIVEVTAIFNDTFHTRDNNRNYLGFSPSIYNGIPLTEQWLIDFGMEMPTNEDPIFEHGEGKYDDPFNPFIKTSQSLIDASFEYDGKEFWEDSNGFWFRIMHTYTHVEYVHQFQNLIFALTGKELTLIKK